MMALSMPLPACTLGRIVQGWPTTGGSTQRRALTWGRSRPSLQERGIGSTWSQASTKQVFDVGTGCTGKTTPPSLPPWQRRTPSCKKCMAPNCVGNRGNRGCTTFWHGTPEGNHSPTHSPTHVHQKQGAPAVTVHTRRGHGLHPVYAHHLVSGLRAERKGWGGC